MGGRSSYSNRNTLLSSELSRICFEKLSALKIFPEFINQPENELKSTQSQWKCFYQ
jgi:hypothetical protein